MNRLEGKGGTLARSHARTLARSHRYAFRLGDSCEYNLYLNSDDGPRVNTLWYFFSVSNIVPGQVRPATVQQPCPARDRQVAIARTRC